MVFDELMPPGGAPKISISSLDPRRLTTFRVVALSGQVSEAARRLHLSQPAVTAQIRQLEAHVGQALFTRHPTGMRLTPEGQSLLEVAQRLHTLLEEAEARLLSSRQAAGPLHLCASTTLAAYVLPSVLAAFRKRYPEASLHLEVGNTDQVLGWVREGRVPLGAVEGSTRAPGLRLEPYLADDLVPVRSKGAFASVREVEDLVAVPLIWRETGSGTRTIIEKALRKADARLIPRETDLIIGHTESIKAAVIEGLGIGFLSRWSIREELRRGALAIIPLPGLRIHRTFSWVQPAGGASGLSQVFLRFAQQNPPAL